VIVDPPIDDAVIDDLEVSDDGAIAPEATEEPIVLEPETASKTVDRIDIASPVEDPVILLAQ
jgi:hypothetical protein